MIKAQPIKVVIINRSFWPIYPVIGEALLRFAEGAVDKGYEVSVIMQDHVGIKKKLKKEGRGKGVRFVPLKALTDSSSSVFLRTFDAIFFMLLVFINLIKIRPNKIYISTDPPVAVPFFVMIYSWFSKAKYVYHLQDIHPEAANIVVPMNPWVFKFLKFVDTVTMRNAECLITITEQMAKEIRFRSNTNAPIYIINNPAVSFDGIDTTKAKTAGFTFCGNAGRLQRIPLVLNAIEAYFNRGGKLKFTFAGGGVFAKQIEEFSEKHVNFEYVGSISAKEAAQLSSDFTWALMPIEDSVTRFAFPSKSSSYVCSGAQVLAICGEDTYVAEWVKSNRVGLSVQPQLEKLAAIFFDIESGKYLNCFKSTDRDKFKDQLGFEIFIEKLNYYVLKDS